MGPPELILEMCKPKKEPIPWVDPIPAKIRIQATPTPLVVVPVLEPDPAKTGFVTPLMQVALPIEFKELLPILYIEDYANTTLLSYDDLNATTSINFVVILDLSHLMIYHLMKTLRIGAIAIIVVEQGVQGELYLPFSEVLDWKKAVILTTMTDLQNLLDNFLTKLPFHTLHRMCRQGYRQIFCCFLLWLINWLYCTNTRQAAYRLPAFCLNCIHMKRATE